MLLLAPPVVFAKGNVGIEKIERIEKSLGVTEKSQATIDNGKIILNLEMTDVEDFAKYKVTINNDSNEKYRVITNIGKLNDDYINYQIDFDDDNTILDSKSKKIFYITATYEKEIPFYEVSSEDSTYRKTTNLKVNFDNNEFISNPLTFSNIIFLLIVGVILGLLIIIMLYKKKTRSYLMLLFPIPQRLIK